MSLYSLIIENRHFLEIFYTLIISFICMVLVLKTDKFYKLSLHQGIRYFRNAFFFYGLAFITKYLFGFLSDFSSTYFHISYIFVLEIFFEYFFIMAGFFLLYSMIWKKFESPGEKYLSSLFNAKIAIFHVMALLIGVFDFLWNTYYLMFFSQILIFFYASIVSLINYKNKGRQHKFLKFYFIAMLLSLVAWILNLLVASYFQWNPGILINIGIINIIFFLLFLCGVIKVIKK